MMRYSGGVARVSFTHQSKMNAQYIHLDTGIGRFSSSLTSSEHTYLSVTALTKSKDLLFRVACVMIAVFPVFSDGNQHNATCSICDCSIKDVVDCSNRSLTYIPTDLNVTTLILNLSYNYLQTLEEGIFENLTMLISLDLYNTVLKKENISPNAFKSLKNLKFLNISHNDQFPLTNKSTPEELFEHIPSLEVLRMYGTTGTYNINHGYPDKQLSKLQSLTELWIDGLTDIAFGPAFRNMTNLKVLRLAGDHIDPSWRSKEFCMTDLRNGMLDNLVYVTHLYIRKCSVKKIDENAFQKLENLEYLDLSKNRKLGLETLFASFCSLPNQTTTLVLNNVVPRYSKSFGNVVTNTMVQCIQYKNIRELHLNHNIIHYIEASAFSTLPKTLQILTVTRNEIDLGLYMFYAFQMTNLTVLDLSFQFFTDETSIWRHQKKSLELEDTPKNRDVHNFRSGNLMTNGSHVDQLELNDKYMYSFDESDDRSSSHGSDFQNFVQQHFLSIAHKDNLQYQNRGVELQNTWKVCPQYNKDRYIPPGTTLAYIPPNIVNLDISHSKHASPINERFFNDSNILENINASSSLFYCWDGPVHGLTKLTTLDLSSNFCTNVSNRFFQTLSNLKRLNISYNFLGSSISKDIEGRILSNLTALEILDISFNLIENIPKLFLKSQKEIIYLNAKANRLEEFDVDIKHMTKLSKLDLKLNRISTLSEETCEDLEKISQLNNNSTSRRTLFVNLRYNAIECSCNNIRFIKWLAQYFDSNSTLAVNVSHCILYENHTQKNFNSHQSLEQMVTYLEYHCRSYTPLIIGLSITIAFIINVILGFVIHRFRWKLQYWYYVVFDKRTIKRGDYELIDEPRYKYDVFVASSDDQKEFVIDNLRSAFKKNGLTAFLAVYHINFNDRLVNVIGKAINESRVVLFVFSNEWWSDRCMNVAVHMWQCDMIERKEPSVLGIYIDGMTKTDKDKVRDIYCRDFIQYPGGTDEEEKDAFWWDCVKKINELNVTE